MHSILKRSYTTKINCSLNNDRHNIIHVVKSKIPEQIKNKIRIAEVSMGRSAVSGMFLGTFTINTTGKSFYTQFIDYEPSIIAMVAAITLGTWYNNKNGISKDKLWKNELETYRMGMVFMVLIFGLEYIVLSHKIDTISLLFSDKIGN